MQILTCDSLAAVPSDAWNSLARSGDPFLSHEFLYGLEQHQCLAPQGWYPSHLVAREKNATVGALPLYVKDNSYGEFVFDWSWADAYERAGGRYYPKFVAAIPFTPVSGERVLLARQQDDPEDTATQLIRAAIALTEKSGASSLHCLFPSAEQAVRFAAAGMLLRKACQYHWFNRDYGCFDDFLGTLKSKRRKQIRRERRAVRESGVSIEILRGDEITMAHWQTFFHFYCSTFYRKWGEPRLTEAFFCSLTENPPGAAVLFLAKFDGDYVAGAFTMRGSDTLYGRHWGCSEHYKQLHFELCYYQVIEYCIHEKLRRVDAGAQGEHKIARGFEPVDTWSAHWIRDPNFRRGVDEFLRRETILVDEYMRTLETHTAYRREA